MGTSEMLCIFDSVTDPYWNLAAEEYILKEFEAPVFRLWRNSRSVIIGRYQNALAEINIPFVKTHGIPVIRRISGGGAVFHDMGNILFTFADNCSRTEDTGAMFSRFTRPIIDALAGLGINAALEGRNDLTIGGMKFSGNAIAYHGNRILQHGTILFSSSMDDLSGALNARPEKFEGKAVKSNRARVTNIREHLKQDMDVCGFMDYLRGAIAGNNSIYEFTDRQKNEITELRNSKYATDEWNFGMSPAFSFSSVRKFPSGLVEIFIDVEKGAIGKLEVRGDYFFSKPTEEFESLMEGTAYDPESVKKRLSGICVDDYFSGIGEDDIFEMFFD